jgi:2-keto-4-pentenoate hydratase/2-oxohepta-3-ene-1,7-dioic acid hydratase in catechol pathway
MRLVSYPAASGLRAGAVVDGRVIDVEASLAGTALASRGRVATIRQLLETCGDALPEVAAAVDAAALAGSAPAGELADLELGPVVPDPGKVLCIGLNYADHVAETGRKLPKHPDVFAKFADSLIGPGAPIGGRDVTDQLDFEGELAIVIGRTTRRVDEAKAIDAIAGITVLNDITARDLQYRGTQWVVGKSVDGSTPVGPAIVTLDEIPDVQALDISTRVNGVEMQRSNTRHMIFSLRAIVAELSRTMTLRPGDIIATGTPDGIGAKRTPPVWLRPGDVVEVELEGVGSLRNVVG